MLRISLAGLGLLAVLGCDSGIVGNSTTTGAWSLRTINGSALPFTISNSDGSKTEIIDDVITLYQGSTYSETIHSRVTVGSQTTSKTTEEAGTYVLLSTSVNLVNSDRTRSRYGLIDGYDMTFVEAGMSMVFRK